MAFFGLLWPSATPPCHPKPGQSARMVRSAVLACGGGARVAKANDGGRSHATLMLLQHEPRGIRRSQCTHGRNAHHGILSCHPAHMNWCGCFERTAQQTTTRHGGGGHRAQDGGNRRRGLRGTGNFRAVTSPGRVCADATARTPNWHRTPALAPSRTAVKSPFIRAKPHPRRLFRSVTDRGHGDAFGTRHERKVRLRRDSGCYTTQGRSARAMHLSAPSAVWCCWGQGAKTFDALPRLAGAGLSLLALCLLQIDAVW